MKGEFKVRVRYEETDQMGVVYYGNYLTWFEVGRAELMRSMGLSYKELEELGIYLPVAEAICRYKNSTTYDELVTIETSVSKLTGVRIIFDYSIYKEDGQIAVQGSTTHAFTDDKGKPVNVIKKAPEAWNIIKKVVDE